MRLFIAIDLNSEMKDELEYLSGVIKANSSRCSTTNRENLHLTLSFIGESDEKDKIIQALGKVSFPPFDLTLENTGHFARGNEKLFYGAMKKEDALMKLQKDISRALKDAGIAFDKKPFRPHITITRRTILQNGYDISSVKCMDVSSPVRSFALYSSDLSGRSPVYTKLAEFPCRDR